MRAQPSNIFVYYFCLGDFPLDIPHIMYLICMPYCPPPHSWCLCNISYLFDCDFSVDWCAYNLQVALCCWCNNTMHVLPLYCTVMCTFGGYSYSVCICVCVCVCVCVVDWDFRQWEMLCYRLNCSNIMWCKCWPVTFTHFVFVILHCFVV